VFAKLLVEHLLQLNYEKLLRLVEYYKICWKTYCMNGRCYILYIMDTTLLAEDFTRDKILCYIRLVQAEETLKAK
jgi:hypothetical protein